MTRPFPDGLDSLALDAERRVMSRPAPPRVKIARRKSGWVFDNPYAKHHEAQWYFLLLDAFGTRHGSVLDHFLATIAELVPPGDRWVAHDQRAYWYPNEPDFNAVLAIVAAMKPDNEAQAALAAQLAALHLASMRVAKYAVGSSDPRSAAILAKTSRAYGEGVERIARLQGKVPPRETKQTIQVVYVDNRSVEFKGGVGSIGGQPQEPYCDNTGNYPNRGHEQCPAVPRLRPIGSAMSSAGRKGEAGLSRPRWRERIRSAFRRAER